MVLLLLKRSSPLFGFCGAFGGGAGNGGRGGGGGRLVYLVVFV